MSNLHAKYVLVGAGVAGNEAARAIRQIDREGKVLLIGQEINRPYHRPPLSGQFLRGLIRREDLFTLPPEWFVENQVDLRTGTRVSHLDAVRNTASLDNGEEISFDRLLLAIGAQPVLLSIPGSKLPNLFYLRTLEDTEHLQLAVAKARKEGRIAPNGRGRAVIIGAGLLGVELASALSQLGLHVDLAVSAAHPWNRYLGDPAGRCLTRYLENHGVVVRSNSRVIRLEGDGRVQRAILSTGEPIDCDFAIAAVGIQINKDILRGTPIAAEKSIFVDPHCQTNFPAIYAAGDCASIFDPLFAKHRIMHHWDSAASTGRIAGTNMAGEKSQFTGTSFVRSQIFELSISIWGEARVVDRRIIRGTPNSDAPNFIEIGIAADGRVAQVVAFGAASTDPNLSKLVEKRVAINGNEERIKDPAIPLADLIGS